MTPRTRKTWATRTDTGRVRTHNEDSILAHPPLFAVADGLGGHEAGEIASSIAIHTLRDHAPRHADAKALARAVRAANREVLRAAREGIGREGMGTTMTAALVEGTHIALAQVGDSRAYLLHGSELTRLTEDHSMVADLVRNGEITEEEAFRHPRRSIITRALGTDPNMVADALEVDASPGDRLLLCSDGLCGLVVDDQIARILGEYRDPTTVAAALIDAANEAGGHDNISVVVVDIESDPAGRVSDRSPSGAQAGGAGGSRARGSRTLGVVLGWLLIAAIVIGGIAYGTYRYARERAYLTVEDGYVTVYRGVPGSLAGISLSWLERTTDIPADELPTAEQSRLSDTITVGGIDAANRLIERYREQVSESQAPDGSIESVQ